MPEKKQLISQKKIESRIFDLRGHKVILDADLARIYGVETGSLNRAVKRNFKRFPKDFIFRLSSEEVKILRCQNGISKTGRGGRRYLPYAFTEHGAIMAATILSSPRAVQMSVFVVRAFVKMRQMLTAQRDLAKKLADLEKKLTDRLDVHETAIVEVLRRIMTLLTPPPDEPEPPRRQIGFGVKEKKKKYGRRIRKGRNFS
jgi:phage regulator Rha-like protein